MPMKWRRGLIRNNGAGLATARFRRFPTSIYSPYENLCYRAFYLIFGLHLNEENFVRTTTTTDEARLACALERFSPSSRTSRGVPMVRVLRDQPHGNYPATLSELAPEFIPSIPAQIVDGKPCITFGCWTTVAFSSTPWVRTASTMAARCSQIARLPSNWTGSGAIRQNSATRIMSSPRSIHLPCGRGIWGAWHPDFHVRNARGLRHLDHPRDLIFGSEKYHGRKAWRGIRDGGETARCEI